MAVARETAECEARVALVPELVSRLTALAYDVAVEPGAGSGALYSDKDYLDAGADVTDDATETADLVVSVAPLDSSMVHRMSSGAATLSFLPAAQSLDLIVERRDRGITSFAMELLPRISRAQSMDALSSQALVAGYLRTGALLDVHGWMEFDEDQPLWHRPSALPSWRTRSGHGIDAGRYECDSH